MIVFVLLPVAGVEVGPLVVQLPTQVTFARACISQFLGSLTLHLSLASFHVPLPQGLEHESPYQAPQAAHAKAS